MRNEVIHTTPANDGAHDEMKGPPSPDDDARAVTRFEREIDGLAAFRFTDLFEHVPPEGACAICRRKHFNWGPLCDTCRFAA